MTALSSATIGSDERCLEPASWSQPPSRERLLDELDAEVARARAADARASSRVQPVFASTRIGPVEDRADRRAASRGPAARRSLILSAGKCGGPGSPLGDDRGLVDADREVGRRDLGRTGRAARGPARPATLPTQVVQGDVDGALGRAVPADRGVHRGGASTSASARRPRSARARPDRLDERRARSGAARRPSSRGLAVVRVRVALPEPDDAREPVVAQLDDDRRDALGRVVVGPGDPERVAEREVQDLVATQAQTPRQGVDAPRGPPPTAGPPRSGPGRRSAGRSRPRSRR